MADDSPTYRLVCCVPACVVGSGDGQLRFDVVGDDGVDDVAVDPAVGLEVDAHPVGRRGSNRHSLRAGLATAAAEAEAQLHDVMRQTRHKSVEVARRYMRSADLWRNNVTEKVMRPRT